MKKYYTHFRLLILSSIVFTNIFGQTYFCRNNTGCIGNWSQNECWSTSSTCSTSSGFSVPNSGTDIIINANSFSAAGSTNLNIDPGTANCNTIDFSTNDDIINVTGGNTLNVNGSAGGFSFRWSNTAGNIAAFDTRIVFNSDVVDFVFTTPGIGTVNITRPIQAGINNIASGTFSITGMSDKIIGGGSGDNVFNSSRAVFQGKTTFNGNSLLTQNSCDFLNDAVLNSSWGTRFCERNFTGTFTRFFGNTLINNNVNFREPTRFYGHTTITGRFNHESANSPAAPGNKMYIASTGSLLFTGDRQNDISWEGGINANGPVRIARTTNIANKPFQAFSVRHSFMLPDSFNIAPALGVMDFGNNLAENRDNGGFANYANAVFVTSTTTLVIGSNSYISFGGSFDPDGSNPGGNCNCWNFNCNDAAGYKQPRNIFGNVHLRNFASVRFSDGQVLNYFNTLSYAGNNLIELGRGGSCAESEPSYQIQKLISSANCANYTTIRAENPGTGNYNNPAPAGIGNANISIPSSINLPGTILQDITNASNNSLVGISAEVDLGGNTRAFIRDYIARINYNGGGGNPLVLSGAFTFTGSSNTFFWIGRGNANDNWSNPANWSATSGGAPIGCVPSTRNNVVFDGGSFTAATQRVVLDGPYQYCKQMTWVNLASVSGVSMVGTLVGSQLQIWDDLVFNQHMINNFTGSTEFNSETSTTGRTFNTVATTTKDLYNFKGPLVFKNSTTDWRLQTDLVTSSSILINSSTLDVSNNGTPGGTISNITITGDWKGVYGTFNARTGTVNFKGTSSMQRIESITDAASNAPVTFGMGDFYNIIFDNPMGFDLRSGQRNKIMIAENGSATFRNGLVYTKFDHDGVSGLTFRKNAKVRNYLGLDISNLSLTGDGLTMSPGGPNNSWVVGDVNKVGDEAFVFPTGCGMAINEYSNYGGCTTAIYRPMAITGSSTQGTNWLNAYYTPSRGASSCDATVAGGSLNNVSVDEFWTLERKNPSLDNSYEFMRARCGSSNGTTATITYSSNIPIASGINLTPFQIGDVFIASNLKSVLNGLGAQDFQLTITGLVGNQITFAFALGNRTLQCDGNARLSFAYTRPQTMRVKLPWLNGTSNKTPSSAVCNNSYVSTSAGSGFRVIKIAQQVSSATGTFMDQTQSFTDVIPWQNYGVMLSTPISTNSFVPNSSKFTLGKGMTPTPLPISNLVYFAAKLQVKKVALQWELNSTLKDKLYTIQRSNDASEFVDLLSEQSPKSNRFATFNRIDDAPHTGTSYYRLKITGTNDKIEYSQIAVVQFEKAQASIAPNPVKSGEIIEVFVNQNEEIKEIQILDVAGRIIVTNNYGSSVQCDFISGLYILKITLTNGDLVYNRIIVE